MLFGLMTSRVYSLLNDFTGFIKAVLILWKLMVNKAIDVANTPARAKTHHPMSIL